MRAYTVKVSLRSIVYLSTLTLIALFLMTLWKEWGSYSEEDKTTDLLNELRASEAAYTRYVRERKSIVNRYLYPGRINPWKGSIFFFDYFLPAFNCPYSVERIGVIGDGGKWMCGIEKYGNSSTGNNERESSAQLSCIVYSFGVNRESSFEAEILERTTCEIYAYDGSVDRMGPEIKDEDEDARRRIHFFKRYIGDKETRETTTLGGIMRKNGHSHIDVLKMDIEGNEFSTLLQVLEEFPDKLPFDQLLLEIHVPAGGENGMVLGVNSPFNKFYKFWEKLEKAGLRPFYKELTLHPCVVLKSLPTVSEYSFINVKGLIM